MTDDRRITAVRLMRNFAERTSLDRPGSDSTRYLWTDAFAVCNFLELFKQTGEPEYQGCATTLIGQVHWVFGRYRNDDTRRG
jgi:hypothetical protein